jgi:hypothetical protein
MGVFFWFVFFHAKENEPNLHKKEHLTGWRRQWLESPPSHRIGRTSPGPSPEVEDLNRN